MFSVGETLFYIVIICVVLYLLISFVLRALRPILLAKYLDEADVLYDKVKKLAEKDYREAMNYLTTLDTDADTLFPLTREEVHAQIEAAKASIQNMQVVHDKFIRLKIRYGSNRKRLSKTIVAYKTYLEMTLKRYEKAKYMTNALHMGSITFDDFMASSKEYQIILEECERNLDVLLNNQ
jgi:hypothetical protein